MLTPAELYPLLERLLQAGRFVGHASARVSLARHLATLLISQDARPGARVRILPAPAPVPRGIASGASAASCIGRGWPPPRSVPS